MFLFLVYTPLSPSLRLMPKPSITCLLCCNATLTGTGWASLFQVFRELRLVIQLPGTPGNWFTFWLLTCWGRSGRFSAPLRVVGERPEQSHVRCKQRLLGTGQESRLSLFIAESSALTWPALSALKSPALKAKLEENRDWDSFKGRRCQPCLRFALYLVFSSKCEKLSLSTSPVLPQTAPPHPNVLPAAIFDSSLKANVSL